MGKRETLIEQNRLEKENRRNILEEKLGKQKYYSEIEELFNTLTKILYVYGENNLPLGKKMSKALNWQS